MGAFVPIAEAGLSALGGILGGRKPRQIGSAAQGSAYWLQNQGNLINTFAGQLAPFGIPELSQFSNWLNQLTSPDATARMTAAAPQISDITKQTQGYERSLANLPPGGQKNYLQALGYQNQATSVANLLTSEFAQAEAAKGALGQWAVPAEYQGMGLAANVQSAAGQLLVDLLNPAAAGAKGTTDALNSILTAIGDAVTSQSQQSQE
jgi:hypothetical protein